MIKSTLAEELAEYKLLVESLLQKEVDGMEQGALTDACGYALLNGGRRFRPALVLMIAEALGKREDAFDAAVGAEMFHTASLVADDLPSMDDETVRRDVPCIHKKFGEATALLVSYALISQGYDCLARSGQPGRSVVAIRNVSWNTGVSGAAGGQYMDLFPPDQTLKTQKEAIQKKTVTLFEMSFVLGWIYGGGDEALLPQVKQAAGHFGLAFQVIDDIEDFDEDSKRDHAVNLAVLLGKEKAKLLVINELDLYETKLKTLSLQGGLLSGLGDYFRSKLELLSKN